jgi:hypothetical protein
MQAIPKSNLKPPVNADGRGYYQPQKVSAGKGTEFIEEKQPEKKPGFFCISL